MIIQPIDPASWLSLDDELVQRIMDKEATTASLRATIPELRENLRQAHDWVSEALMPVSPTHPSEDTWDDRVYFTRALQQSGYSSASAAYEEAAASLEELEGAEDPRRAWAGWVLRDAHRYLKLRGFRPREKRLASRPIVVGNCTLADILWHGRNQDEHCTDNSDRSPDTVTLWRALLIASPASFGLSSPPQDDEALQGFLRAQSWSSELLQLLGWSCKDDIVEGIRSIQD